MITLLLKKQLFQKKQDNVRTGIKVRPDSHVPDLKLSDKDVDSCEEAAKDDLALETAEEVLPSSAAEAMECLPASSPRESSNVAALEKNEQIIEIADVAKETPAPSAPPPVEINEFDRLMNLNKNLASEITQQQQHDSFLHFERKIVIKSSIKPYTEDQLAALYTNTELDTLEQFTSQYVEAELRGLATKQHPLYELLSNYLHVRTKITGLYVF